MNIQKIAEFLLERRHRASPIVLTGEILEAIQSDGLQEALMRRWVVPDGDTGNLTVTSYPAHVAEMEELAKNVYHPEAAHESEATPLVMGHAQRHLLQEISPPGTGKPAPAMIPAAATPTPASPVPPAPAATPTAPPAAAAPPAAVEPAAAGPNAGKKLGIGDEVDVEEGRRAYRGKISARKPNGNYSVAFGAERPAHTRDYAPDEVRSTHAT